MDSREPIVTPSPPLQLGPDDQPARAARLASQPLLIGLVAVSLLSASCVGLALHSLQVIGDNQHEFATFKATVLARCEQRQTYDKANNDSTRADARLYAQLLEISDRAPRQTDPRLAALIAEQRAVILEAQLRKEAAAKAGVIGDCKVYR